MNHVAQIVLAVASGLGITGVLFKWGFKKAAEEAPEAADEVVNFLEKSPALVNFILAHEAEIVDIIEKFGAEAKKKLEADAAKAKTATEDAQGAAKAGPSAS